MATGTVRFFNASKGFGLITPDTGGPSIFARKQAITSPGVKVLMVAQRVQFDLVQNAEGPAATNIRTL